MAAWFASTWSSVSSVSSDLAATAVEVIKSTIVPVIADSLATITRKRGREEEPAVCVPAKAVVAASSPSPALANNEVIVGSSNSKRGRLAIADEDGNADQMAAYAALVGVAAKLPAATRLASFDSLTAQFRGTGARSLEAASDLSRRIGVYAKPAIAFDVGRWPADTTRKRWDWKHRSKGVQLVHSSVTSLPVDTVQHQPPSEAPSHQPPALNASQLQVPVAATAAPQRHARSALLAYTDATAAATSPVKLTTAPAITAPAGLTPALASLHVLRQRAASTTHVGGAGAAAVSVAPPPQLRRQAPPEAAPAAVTSPRAPPGSGSPVPVMSSTMSAFGWAADSLVGGLWSQSEDNGAPAPSPSLGTAAVAVASPSSHGVLPSLGASTASPSSHGVLPSLGASNASPSSHGVLPSLGASSASTGVAGDFALLGGNLGARVKAAVTLLQSVKILGGDGAASTGAIDDRNSDLLAMINNLIHGRPPGEGRGKDRPAAPVAAAVPGSAARSIASAKSPLPPARLASAATAAAGAPPAPPSQPPQPAKEQEQEEVLDDDEVVVDDGDGVIDLMGDEDEDEQDGGAAGADDDGVIDLVSDEEEEGDGTEEDNAADRGEEEEEEEEDEEDAVMEDEEGADDAGDDDWQWLVTPADKSGSITEDDYRMLSRFLRPDPESTADLMARHAGGLAVVGACDTDTVTLGNLQCLNDGEWVNDEVVNFEVKRLNHVARAYAAAVAQEVMTSSQADAGAGEGAGATATASSSSSSSAAPSASSSAPPAAADGPAVDSRGATRRSPRIWVTTSHFLARLAETSAGYDYPGVARWSKKAKVDIADLDLILVPINWGNTHWALAVIDLLHQAIHYYDSMSPVNGTDAAVYDVGSHPDERDAGSAADGEDDDEDPAAGGRWAAKCRHLARWVRDEWKAKHGEAVDTAPWPILIHPRATVPQQRNTFDCGMFAVHLARCIVTGQRFSFSQADIPVLRRRLALDIIKSGPTGNGVMATGF